MASDNDWYAKLNRVFRTPSQVRRRARNYKTPTISTATQLFSKSQSYIYSNAINAYGQYDRLSRYSDFGEMEYCLHGDTKIATAGGYKTIRELADEFGCRETFEVYSYDHESRKIVCARGKQARRTRTDHAYEVKFDDGKTIIGSANHRLMLRTGEYKRIEELVEGDEMMPFAYDVREHPLAHLENSPHKGEMSPWIYDGGRNSWQSVRELLLEGCLDKRETHDVECTVKFSTVLDACDNIGFNISTVCEHLSIDECQLHNALNSAGFECWETFVRAYRGSHEDSFAYAFTGDDVRRRVSSISYYGKIDLYDLTVDGYKNFATDSVISHNTPEISAALDIYADETCSQDEHGTVLHIYSENRKIRELLEQLFYDTLNVDFNLRMWIRNIVKYGDFFMFNDIAPGEGIIQAFPIPVNEIEREEGFDPNDPQAVQFRWVTQGNIELENWQVTHFRLQGNDAFLPYGSSVIEPARRIWRQLILVEDAMLVYRIVRSPERRIFYIDVGGVPPEEVPNYMAQQEAKLRSNPIVDKSTGRVDYRHNPMETLEDYFIPVRGGESGTKIDTLSGGQHVSATEDVEYIQKKLFAALKIPRAYLGYDEMLSSKATLAQEDIRFSRTIQQIQKAVVAELYELAQIHLFMNGYEGEDMFDFELRLNNPSSIAQQQKLELFARKFEIVGNALQVAEGKVFSLPYVLRTIMDMSEQQQRVMHEEIVDDVQRRAALSKIEEGATPESVGFSADGGFSPPGDLEAQESQEFESELGGGDEFGGGEEGDEAAGDEGGGDEGGGLEDLFQHDEPMGDVLDEDDDEEQDEKPSLLDTSAVKKSSKKNPVKVSHEMQRKQNNRRRNQRRHGAEETGFVDFARMTGMNDPQDKDIYDSGSLSGLNMRDVLVQKLEHLERLGDDSWSAKQRVDLYEKLDALDVLNDYMSHAEPDNEPPQPRLRRKLVRKLEELEDVFGPELSELRTNDIIGNILVEDYERDPIDEIVDDDDDDEQDVLDELNVMFEDEVDEFDESDTEGNRDD